MAGKIPRAFIDDLIARHDIVDVIDARVKLKKAGKNFSACCPFHNEKTPSFSVSQEKQFYHCFGCGVHGNVLDFVMEFDRLEFVDAVEELSSQLGLDVPREDDGFPSQAIPKQEKRNFYEQMTNIAQFYETQLKKPSGKIAIDYLKNRGLSGEIVKKFGIGYIPDEWDLVRKQFGQDNESQTSLVTTGMLIENDQGRRYDRFRGRVMFPIHDRRGRVIGFGGRVLGDGTPKYLNSPETPIFHKGKELYALYQVLQAHREPERILVVEGYMDVVALAQFGVDYAVASLGTATTGDHMHSLFRQTSTVVCCYDGDRAGREAAWRAMEQALPYLSDGRQLKFMFLPDGEDPDSYIRQYGQTQFEQQIRESMTLSDFMFSSLNKQVDSSSREGKTKLKALAMPLIEQIAGEALKEILIDSLGYTIGLSPEQIRLESSKHTRTHFVAPSEKVNIKRTPMRTAIALLIQNPSFVQSFEFETHLFKDFQLAGLNLLVAIIDKCRVNPNISTGQLLEYWRGHQNETMIAKLATWELPLTAHEDNTLDVFLDTLDNIVAQCVNQQIEKLQAKLKSVGLSVEEKRELQALILNPPVSK